MSKQIIIGAIVVAIIVGGVLIFKGQGSKDFTETPIATSPVKETTTSNPSSVVKKDTNTISPSASVTNTTKVVTLQETYKSGQTMKCTVDTSAQKFTYYFKDGNIRYETSMTSGSTKIETGFIIKKDVAYGWTSMSSSIVTVTDPKTIEFYRSTAFQLDTLISNPRANIKLSCSQTTISNSLFDKP